MKRKIFWLALALAIGGGTAAAQQLPLGQIVDDVECREDRSQQYALYLPSTFTPERRWPVILLFDAGARGRRGVERYQDAAERYGYIVAGSNNSRNGPWEVALDAAKAMMADVSARFPVDSKRIYTGGMSGGARVAMMIALTPSLMTGPVGPEVAGVLASSAGFPPDDFHESVRFAIFGTAGTEDFNYQEMRELNRNVKTPHRVEVFEGGHTWLPVELAVHGVEWMEIQAMKSGLRPRDERIVNQIFAARVASAEAEKTNLGKMRASKAVAEDFHDLRDVEALRDRAASLERRQDVKDALKMDGAQDEREVQTTADVFYLLSKLNDAGGFEKLKARVVPLIDQARRPSDSFDRRISRRVLASLNAAARGVPHPEFQELLKQSRPATAQPQ